MSVKEKLIPINSGPMLNAYPDSIGGDLNGAVAFLKSPKLKDVFQSFYILPSVFNFDLDRGFSIIDYNLNTSYATNQDLNELKKLNIALKFDFVLNHSSVLSKEFQDILQNGESSKYVDFFIRWNKFWNGFGEMTGEGYIQPDAGYIKDMFFRKPGLPILMVRMPDGKEVPYWNTFYQKVKYEKIDAIDLMRVTDIQYSSAQRLAQKVNATLDNQKLPMDVPFNGFESYREDTINLLEGRRKYLGQMDLNIQSPLVWEYYEETLQKLASYGAQVVRLDAFAYAPKQPGSANFLNNPGTWDLLNKIKQLADNYGLTLLPEIHSRYEEKIHEKLSQQGYLTYDFFLPGLLIDAFERNTNEVLLRWIGDIMEKDIKVVNMLGCHDGIPLLDLKGLLPEKQIQNLIDTVVKHGGFVKDLHGKKNMYYQVNATYYSALGENDAKLLLARAIQLFMPGKPQVWYLDLLAGKNDHIAVKKAGVGGHKEINRSNLSLKEAISDLNNEVVQQQVKLLNFRNTFPAFGFDSKLTIDNSKSDDITLQWEKDGNIASLNANFSRYTFYIKARDSKGNIVCQFSQD